jgi:hypothetical protein
MARNKRSLSKVSDRAALRRSERRKLWEKDEDGDPRIMHIGGIEEFLRYEATVELIEQLLKEIVTVGPDDQVRIWNYDLAPSSPLRAPFRRWIELDDE